MCVRTVIHGSKGRRAGLELDAHIANGDAIQALTHASRSHTLSLSLSLSALVYSNSILLEPVITIGNIQYVWI